MTLDHFLVIVHFVGLTMGLSTGFANMIMAGLIAKAPPQEKPVLGRFPPAMSRVGVIGLSLLWISGVAIVMTRYGGFSILPRTFIIKLSAVMLLTLAVVYIQVLLPKAQRGDAAAMARIQTLGKLTGPLALIAIVFAVLTFG
ncbi:MAG TPA: hypothetical protein VEA16_15340 [Vicinamibacterales bacterium]|nr:hypothetical protein [Vicinamibacterales bacterium]